MKALISLLSHLRAEAKIISNLQAYRSHELFSATLKF